jgi:hypothetical protein
VGKVVQPLQSVKCHDSHAHGHEQHGPFPRLVGYGWFGSSRVLGLFGLATGVRHVSYPVLRKRERSLHTCVQDVQITRIVTT